MSPTSEVLRAGTPFVARTQMQALDEMHLACRTAGFRWRLHSAARVAALELSVQLELDHATVKCVPCLLCMHQGL